MIRWLQHIREWLQGPENFDIADIVRVIQEHPDSAHAVRSILELDEAHRYGALRTLIIRCEEMGAPRRLIVCLAMLKDPVLAAEVLKKLPSG